MELQGNRFYRRDECAVFLKTNERFGGLSNMAGGYSLFVNGIRILTSEALYQACRFPHKPDVQKLIIGQVSPMTAKMKSKPYRQDSRLDWDEVRVQIMHWCLRVKLVQHWEKFGDLLLSTENRPIVEESYRDPFWGAKPSDSETLVGTNVLGQLLTELREQLKGPKADELRITEPPTLPQFLLMGKPIGAMGSPKPKPRPMIVPVPLESTNHEQLALDSDRADTIPTETEEIAAQRLLSEASPPFSPLQHQLVAIQHELPLDGVGEVFTPQKLNTTTRRKKVS
jgi:ribA/ribD-fused uncharacterized protein